jgi:SpoVK/Ycf46/Vps4 family AAA+-type ATPase
VGRDMRDNDKAPKLDITWIEDALEKRRANFSTVICCRTRDPKRHKQLLEYICNLYREAQLYLFDPWKGLSKFDSSQNRFSPVQDSSGDSSEYVPELRNKVTQLSNTLRLVDTVLKSGRTVFVLGMLESFSEAAKSQELLSALRSWSQDGEIIYQDSLIVLLIGEPSLVIDNFTSSLLAFVEAPASSIEERREVIQDVARNVEVNLPYELETLAIATGGLNLHQLEGVLLEAYHRTKSFDLQKIKELKAEFIKRSELLEVEEPARGFDAIGGYQVIKDFIYSSIIEPLGNPQRAACIDLPLPRGLLLFGPPGTGKSLFAKALAKEVKLPFIHFRVENLIRKWLGESGERTRDAVRLVEQMSPAIAFIDEIDRLGQRTASSDSASEETRRVFSQILEWLGDENRRAIIVGTTNRPQDLDEAFTRAGRLDYKIPVLYPDQEARKQILAVHMGLTGVKHKPPYDFSDIEGERLIAEVASATENFSGAELEQLIARAKRIAFKRRTDYIGPNDFLEALETFHINEEERREQMEEFLAFAETYTDDSRFLEQLRKESSW